ncbi:MAG: hypothetical protein ACI4FX_03120 [Agathobacter sp.]
MEVYVTTEKMLGNEPLTSFLQSTTKKERMLYLYHSADSSLSFEDASTLLSAAKRMPIEFRETKNPDDFAFSLGYLAGTLKAKSPVYTILPPDCELSDSVRELYHLEEYKPATPTVKKRSRPVEQKVRKEDAVSESDDAKPESIVVDKKTTPVQKVPEEEFMNPPEQKSQTGQKPTVDTEFDPLFFSEDSEKFFSKQLGMTNGYQEVALCMKESGNNKSKAEGLIRKRIGLIGADMEMVVNTVRQKWDILYGCLFIRRR